jgi:hypothetical protein
VYCVAFDFEKLLYQLFLQTRTFVVIVRNTNSKKKSTSSIDKRGEQYPEKAATSPGIRQIANAMYEKQLHQSRVGSQYTFQKNGMVESKITR